MNIVRYTVVHIRKLEYRNGPIAVFIGTICSIYDGTICSIYDGTIDTTRHSLMNYYAQTP